MARESGRRSAERLNPEACNTANANRSSRELLDARRNFKISRRSSGSVRSATSRLTTTVGAAHLKEDISVDSGMDLARIYQYLDETRGSLFVQNTVQNFYNRDYPTKSAHAFFASLGPVLRARGAGRGVRLNSVLTTNRALFTDILDFCARVLAINSARHHR